MIKGNKDTVSRAKNAGPDAKWNHVNFDAIEALPDEFEAVITEVRYNKARLEDDFSDVGNGNYMPKPELMYAIAEACGISGGSDSINEPMVELVDYNRMIAKFDAPPQMVQMTVGRIVKKYSTIINEDGTERKSSVCTSAYNVFERCCELWSKEEEATNGYENIQNGPYTAFNRPQNGPHYTKGKYVYPVKYATRWQRQSNFDTEMKFAGAKAESKAYLKTIRELAGMMTGFRKEDLIDGMFVFSKIRRSSAVLKMETAARLAALSRGESSGAAQALFGPQVIEESVMIEHFEEPAPAPAPEQKKPIKDEMLWVLSSYMTGGLLDEEGIKSAQRITAWLEKTDDPESLKQWPDVKQAFIDLDNSVISEGKITHGIN